MKPRLLLSLLTALAGAAALVPVRADSTDDAIAAAMKLSSAVNYTWNATIIQNSHTAKIDGKTSADGYSLATFTGFSTGGSSGVNTVFLGDSKYVIDRSGTWVLATDSTTSTPPVDSGAGNAKGNSNAGSATKGSRRSRGGAGGIGGIGGTGTSGSRRGSSGSDASGATGTPAPKLPSGVNLPHEELAIIASNYTAMQPPTADGVVAGTLTEWGADQLLVPPGWSQSPPDKAAGTFRLWLKDGTVIKYEVKLTAETGPGGVTIKGGLAKTITVEITDVGATQMTVPPAAKAKLGV